jgi:hypothetical protein
LVGHVIYHHYWAKILNDECRLRKDIDRRRPGALFAPCVGVCIKATRKRTSSSASDDEDDGGW